MFVLYLAAFAYKSSIVGFQHSHNNAKQVDGPTIAIRCLQMFRLVSIPRDLQVLLITQSSIKITKLLRRIFLKIYTIGVFFCCGSFFFATIGVFCFGGLISKSSSDVNYDELLNSEYGQNGYWSLNFNDFISAFVTLFVCLHVSDFDVISTGFTAVTTNAAKLFFVAWYIVGVLLMLNILKSFFLGEFLLYFAFSNTKKTGLKTPKLSPEFRNGVKKVQEEEEETNTGIQKTKKNDTTLLKSRLLKSINNPMHYIVDDVDDENKKTEVKKNKDSEVKVDKKFEEIKKNVDNNNTSNKYNNESIYDNNNKNVNNNDSNSVNNNNNLNGITEGCDATNDSSNDKKKSNSNNHSNIFNNSKNRVFEDDNTSVADSEVSDRETFLLTTSIIY
jgi:hypothetical protein